MLVQQNLRKCISLVFSGPETVHNLLCSSVFTNCRQEIFCSTWAQKSPLCTTSETELNNTWSIRPFSLEIQLLISTHWSDFSFNILDVFLIDLSSGKENILQFLLLFVFSSYSQMSWLQWSPSSYSVASPLLSELPKFHSSQPRDQSVSSASNTSLYLSLLAVPPHS